MTESNNTSITIESLFETDKTLAFWQLRERALEAGMSNERFLINFNLAIRTGDVEIDPTTGDITLMAAPEPITTVKAKFQFKRSGRKIPNKLCEKVIEYAELLARTGSIMKDYSESTIEDVFRDISMYAELVRVDFLCKPMAIEWNGYKNRDKFGIWENQEAVYMKASALGYISIVQED